MAISIFYVSRIDYSAEELLSGLRQKIEAGPLEVEWLGTAGVLISSGQDALLIDPFVSRHSMLSVGLGRDMTYHLPSLQRIDASLKNRRLKGVLVSHSHFDHSLDAPWFAERHPGSLLYGSESTLNIGRGAGLTEQQLHLIKDRHIYRLGEFTVTVLESRHGPALFGRIPYPGKIESPLPYPAAASDYRLGRAYTFIVEARGTSIMHHGSAAWRKNMLCGIKVDLLLVGLAGRGDTDAYIRTIIKGSGARRIYGLHFDDFFAPAGEEAGLLWGIDLSGFDEAARRHKVSYRLPVKAASARPGTVN